jgi:hypothetical protein
MGDIKLTTPRVLIIREGHEPLEVQTDNRDLVRYDLTRPKQRPAWPDPTEAPSFWLTFIAWSAANRQGAIPTDMKWEPWLEQVLNIQQIDDENPNSDGEPFPQGEQGTADL